eukprot:13392445-Alexandrium_andersonii.AAC.1
MTHEVPSVPLAHDVWALLREGAGPLRHMMDYTPLNAVVLIVAGSPCQDLTYAGATRGAVGVCGTQSRLFWAVLAVALVLQHLRPDINVQVVVENA